jgi:hypothetical protein
MVLARNIQIVWPARTQQHVKNDCRFESLLRKVRRPGVCRDFFNTILKFSTDIGFGGVHRLFQSEVTPIVATDKRLGANEFLVRNFGKRIVEIAPRRGAEIDCLLPTEIIRDWASNDVEGGSTIGGNRFDEISWGIKWKS